MLLHIDIIIFVAGQVDQMKPKEPANKENPVWW